ncbi:MAG TPA: hypothetical protein PK970_07535 [Hyphomicrobiaceae bacterium]|nr:hypothetical protein [Hyphomicrobiaceae bacterium]
MTMPKSKLEHAFDRMLAMARELELPGVSEGTWHGRPCLKMRGISIIGSKDGQVLVIHCPIDEKEFLLEAAANIYFETDHYKGYPAILARPEHMKGDELRSRIERAWRMHATKRQRAEYDARSKSKSASPKARPSG